MALDPEAVRREEARSRKLRRRLADIVSYGTSVVEKLRGRSSKSFIDDADLHDLIYFRLLCVSEAVKNVIVLSPDIAARHRHIPWVEVRAFGNVLRHEYGEVDAMTVWQTFERGDIAALITAARQELNALDG